MKPPRMSDRPEAGKGASPLTSDLAARIARAKAEAHVTDEGLTTSAVRDMSGLSRGLRLGSEFIAAILVGAGIGYLLDLWLNTSPWLMLVMVLVGFAAGVLNVIRSTTEMNRAAPPPTAAMRVPDDEDDE